MFNFCMLISRLKLKKNKFFPLCRSPGERCCTGTRQAAPHRDRLDRPNNSSDTAATCCPGQSRSPTTPPCAQSAADDPAFPGKENKI